MCYRAATSWLRCGVLSCPSPKPSMVGLELWLSQIAEITSVSHWHMAGFPS
jgi:hypothetical protein